jgi:sugar transferase (PEP-CTERM/EpsH1 system associated)
MKILVVTLQFPYPAQSGFAMRVLQLTRQLAAHHEVTLLAYARADERDAVAALRRELRVVTVDRRFIAPGPAKRAAQLGSVLSPRPFACRNVHTPEMQAAIDALFAQESFDAIQLESSQACSFRFPADVPVILDEHNVESELLRRMGERERSLVRRAFSGLEYRRYRRFEQRVWQRVSGCAVTSARELPTVNAAAPWTPVAVVPNGVDLDYFAPSAAECEPDTVVFNGVLDYRPNLDGAQWLVDEVWPLVRARHPQARLTVVGRSTGVSVKSLEAPGVTLAGEVPDIRPYLRHAAVVTVPIRIGGGTRLKVVEGLAMGKAMVSTSLGCEGVAVEPGRDLLVADTAHAFARHIASLFADRALRDRLGRAGRRLSAENYSWKMAGDGLQALYARALATGDDPSRARATGATPRSLAVGGRA